MIYQVNARSLAPYYTTDRAEALRLFAYLRKYGPPCSIRTTTRARAIWKTFKAGGLPAGI
ncbi:MAG: hypothetical protein IIW40_05855 [Clostridia bacterium]|nr:hypothetical protein [Clostridia bacterium]